MAAQHRFPSRPVARGGLIKRRPSTEVFDVDTKGTQPALTWVGCILAPEKAGFNAVVALPGGGVAATHARSGVWEWHAKSGWKIIPGSEDTVSNGIEISRDGRTLYINGWEEQKITRLSRGLKPVNKDAVKVLFRPDNIRWSPDRSLLYSSGMGNVQTPRELSVETSNVFQVDPKTLAIKWLFAHPYIKGWSSGRGAASRARRHTRGLRAWRTRGVATGLAPVPRNWKERQSLAFRTDRATDR
jgi:hypothetical protein